MSDWLCTIGQQQVERQSGQSEQKHPQTRKSNRKKRSPLIHTSATSSAGKEGDHREVVCDADGRKPRPACRATCCSLRRDTRASSARNRRRAAGPALRRSRRWHFPKKFFAARRPARRRQPAPTRAGCLEMHFRRCSCRAEGRCGRAEGAPRNAPANPGSTPHRTHR